MITPDELRKVAMSLPEVEEGPPVPSGRGILAFKVAGKSFSVWRRWFDDDAQSC